MSVALTRAKADSESRLQDEKKKQERRKNLIVLCARYLQDQGYLDSSRQIQEETKVSLDRIDLADNIDLCTILTEYEDFYEMRFGRKPKISRKVAEAADRKSSLPRLPEGRGRKEDKDDGEPEPGRRRERSQSRKREEKARPPLPPDDDPEMLVQNTLDMIGQHVCKQAHACKSGKPPKDDGGAKGSKALPSQGAAKADEDDDKDDFFEARLLKALPDFGGDKEYRDLALAISRDILTKNPGTNWDSIVGLSHAKSLLKEAVVMPLKYPQLFTGLLTPWKGVLLFGPPGTGKTLLAKAVATECETTFFNVSASTLVSKWRGDSEKLVRVLFDLARHHQPSTIFVDELDSIMSSRSGEAGEHEGSRRMKTELLIQLDGLSKDAKDQVFLLAASNLPWDLDSAMLRRLEKRILVDLPSAEAREAMLRQYLPVEAVAEGIDYTKLASLTNEWSGSDIRLLCKEAAMHPLRRLMVKLELIERQPEAKATNRQRAAKKCKAEPDPVELKVGPVTEDDTVKALATVHRAPAAHTDRYVEWQTQFGAA